MTCFFLYTPQSSDTNDGSTAQIRGQSVLPAHAQLKSTLLPIYPWYHVFDVAYQTLPFFLDCNIEKLRVAWGGCDCGWARDTVLVLCPDDTLLSIPRSFTFLLLMATRTFSSSYSTWRTLTSMLRTMKDGHLSWQQCVGTREKPWRSWLQKELI